MAQVIVETTNSTNGVLRKRCTDQRAATDRRSDVVQIRSFCSSYLICSAVSGLRHRLNQDDVVDVFKEVRDRSGVERYASRRCRSRNSPDEFVACFGRSAGKSTLIFNERDAARHRRHVCSTIGSLLIRHLDSLKQSIRYVPQGHIIHRAVTVFSNSLLCLPRLRTFSGRIK